MSALRRLKAAAKGFLNPDRVVSHLELSRLACDKDLRDAWRNEPDRWDRIKLLVDQALNDAGLSGGKMLEIGGRRNPRDSYFPAFDYYALDLEKAPADASVKVASGDITGCPQIPSESYDFIFSLDVFEHIDRPWLAAQEIQRLLKPGGVTFHSTLFSWRYHPCPIDYWRYSAEGLKSLFDQLDCLHADFDYVERRRDLRGRGTVSMAQVDSLGGWRENVRVNYAGVKR